MNKDKKKQITSKKASEIVYVLITSEFPEQSTEKKGARSLQTERRKENIG